MLHECVVVKARLLAEAGVINNSGNQKNLGSLVVNGKEIHIFFMDPK